MSRDHLGAVRCTACTDSQSSSGPGPCAAALVSDNSRLAGPHDAAALQRIGHGIHMTLFDKLQALIATTLKVPPAKITPTTQAEDLPSWDSLGQVNLIMALEQTFDVYIEVEEFANLNSVPAILEHLGKNGVS
jgi:acyl carrier protein